MLLRSFRVANHRSIRDEQELVLLPAYDKLRPTVPVAAVFGANASGKSNLLDALRFMRSAVRTSYAEWEPGAGVPRSPFKLDPQRLTDKSTYVVDLILDGLRYVYGFAVDDSRVHEEWLYVYPHRRRRVIFERTVNDLRLGPTVPDSGGRGELLAGLTRDNALLLSAASRANQEEVKPVYEWFRAGLILTGSLDPDGGPSEPQAGRRRGDFGRTGNARLRPDGLMSRLDANPQARQAIVDLVRAADLGVVDIEIDDPARQTRRLLDQLNARLGVLANLQMAHAAAMRDSPDRDAERQLAEASQDAAATRAEIEAIESRLQTLRHQPPSLLFLHGPQRVPLTFAEQSDGTRAWIGLIGSALDALATGATVIVDEIDSSLHPHLTARLIHLFQEDDTNPRGGQLVFTTHDATLLSPALGEDTLARDQIWFVEKDSEGATTLFPLTDFHPRREENTARRYLTGSYGALPTTSEYAFRKALDDAVRGDAAS